MFCLSATAERNGVEYIAVIMHGDTSDQRFQDARALLDYAFANYATVPLRAPDALSPVAVKLGDKDGVQPIYSGPPSSLVGKGDVKNIRYELDLPESVTAPVEAGQQLGALRVYLGDNLLDTVPITAGESVERLNAWKIFLMLSRGLFGGE
jgi:D-alanyl-D-alanine carboxypeptidase (penicillin-binding protein 5/6)